jgi:thioredoxin-dependent peroxiredoxin
MKTMVWGVAALFGLGIVLSARIAAADDLKVGDKAPDFTLKASDGKTYSLADFKGKKGVVIAWFPKAFTGGCTAECKSFKASGDALKSTNVAYFTASVDPLETNAKFAASLGIDYPILSDPEKSTAKAYGILNPAGMSSRVTFYIDKEGVIKEIDKKVNTAKAGDDVVAKVKSLGIGG